jgi:hypothetical protein
VQTILKLIGAIAVIALVIVGLINFDLLLTITAKLIAAVVIVGILATLVRLLFFHQR